MPVITSPLASLLRVGDVVSIHHGSRWRAFISLLRRPRALVVVAVTQTTYEIEERRMSWAEWRRAMLALMT